MTHFRSLPHLVALSALALGCKTGKSFDRTTEPGGRPLSRTTTGSLIIRGRALSADPGRTVLDAIRHSMPQLRIAGWTQYTRCPLLEMRGKDSVEGTNNPDVYVDGTRTSDTCPLVTIQAVSTERIERARIPPPTVPEAETPGECLPGGFLQLRNDRGDYCRPVNQSGF